MSLNKIKINQLDFDISQIALGAGSGSFISTESLIASSGVLRNDINNQSVLINQLSNSGNLISGQLSSLSGNCVFLTGNQTINGLKTFTSRPLMNGTGFILSGEVSFENIKNLVYNTGDQNISGVKTFFSKPTLNGTGFVFSNETGSFIKNDDLRLNHHTLLLVTGAGQSSVNGYYYKTNQFLNSKILWNSITSQYQRIVWQPTLGWCIEDYLQGGGGWTTRYRQTNPEQGDAAYAGIEPPDVVKWLPHNSLNPGVPPAPDLFWTKSVYSSNHKELNFFKLVSGSDSAIKFGFDGNFLNSDVTVKFKKKNGTIVLNTDYPVYATGQQTISGVKNFDSIPTYSNASLVYSGAAYANAHTHPISDISNLNSALSGKVNVLEYATDIIGSSTPKTPISNGNSLFNYVINHTGANVVRLPRLGVANAPREGDEIVLQFNAAVGIAPSTTTIQTGNPDGNFSDFFTINNGVGGVSLFYGGGFWRLKSPIVNHANTHFTNGLDPINPLNIGAAPRQDFASFEWRSPAFNFAKATGAVDGPPNGLVFNATPANYIPFNHTVFNTNTGLFELINTGSAVGLNDTSTWTGWSGRSYGATGNRIKISQSGIYEFNVATHFYDASGNCDFYVNLVRSNTAQGASWTHIATLVDERYHQIKSDRFTNSSYIYNKTDSNIEFFTATVVTNCDGNTNYTNFAPSFSLGNAVFPSNNGSPTRIQIKKLM